MSHHPFVTSFSTIHHVCPGCNQRKLLVADFSFRTSTLNEHLVQTPSSFTRLCHDCSPRRHHRVSKLGGPSGLPLQQRIQYGMRFPLMIPVGHRNASLLFELAALWKVRAGLVHRRLQTTSSTDVAIVSSIRITRLIRVNSALFLVSRWLGEHVRIPKATAAHVESPLHDHMSAVAVAPNNKETETTGTFTTTTILRGKKRARLQSFPAAAQHARARSHKRGVDDRKEYISTRHLTEAWAQQEAKCSLCGELMLMVSRHDADANVMSVNRMDSTDKQRPYHDGTTANFDLQHWGCNRAHSKDEILPHLLHLQNKWNVEVGSKGISPFFPNEEWMTERRRVRTEQMIGLAKQQAKHLRSIYECVRM